MVSTGKESTYAGLDSNPREPRARLAGTTNWSFLASPQRKLGSRTESRVVVQELGVGFEHIIHAPPDATCIFPRRPSESWDQDRFGSRVCGSASSPWWLTTPTSDGDGPGLDSSPRESKAHPAGRWPAVWLEASETPAGCLPHPASHNLFTTYHVPRTTHRLLPDSVNDVLGSCS